MEKFLEAGKIVNIHGLKGEVKIVPWSDDNDFICEFDTIYCGKDKKVFKIENARVHKNTVLVKLVGIDTPEAANLLRNNIVYIDRNEVELEEGCFFIADLIGLTVKNIDTGEEIGKVTDIFQTGANDVYEVKNNGKAYYIPGIPDVIIETDIEKGVIAVRPLEGLLDED